MCNCSTFKPPLSLSMWWSPFSLVLSLPVQKETQEKYNVSQIHSSPDNMLILTMSCVTLRFLWRTLLYNLLFYSPCVSLLMFKECSIFDRMYFIFRKFYIIISTTNSKNYCQYFSVVQGHRNPLWQLTVENPNTLCDIHSGKHASSFNSIMGYCVCDYIVSLIGFSLNHKNPSHTLGFFVCVFAIKETKLSETNTNTDQ